MGFLFKKNDTRKCIIIRDRKNIYNGGIPRTGTIIRRKTKIK